MFNQWNIIMKRILTFPIVVFLFFIPIICKAQLATEKGNVNTQLIEAVIKGDIQEVQSALKAGADINTTVTKHINDVWLGESLTPLILASYYGHKEIVKILLDNGADINLKVATKGATPLIAALITSSIPSSIPSSIRIPPPSYTSVVRLLLDRGADVKIKGTYYLFTPLIIAIQWSRYDTSNIKLLLDKGADINGGKEIGDIPPLLAAANFGNKEAVKLFLDRGVNINTKSEIEGETALSLATLQGHTEVVKLLLERGADVNAKLKTNGRTALFIASQLALDRSKIVKLLLDKGADVNAIAIIENVEYTPLKIANKNGRKEIVEILEKAGAKE